MTTFKAKSVHKNVTVITACTMHWHLSVVKRQKQNLSEGGYKWEFPQYDSQKAGRVLKAVFEQRLVLNVEGCGIGATFSTQWLHTEKAVFFCGCIYCTLLEVIS